MAKREYDDRNRGVLFKNDRKTKESQPDYRGHINVGGSEFWLSAWLKESRDGELKFLSVAVTEKTDEPEDEKPKGRKAPRKSSKKDDDEDVPF